MSSLFPLCACRYAQLAQLGKERRQKLEDSKQKFELMRGMNELEHWINDKVHKTLHCTPTIPLVNYIYIPFTPHLSLLSLPKESLASADESIKDLEHAEVLAKKHDDFQKDVAANEARLDSINTLAQTMIDEGHSDSDEIQRLTEVGGVSHSVSQFGVKLETYTKISS